MKSAGILVKPALSLVLIGLVAAVLLAGLNTLTADRIRQAQDQRALQTLLAVLPPERFDNHLAGDWTFLDIAGLTRPAKVYRARLDGQASAAIIDLTTPRGYSGDIRLLIAMTPDAEIISVRVLEHHETPGLGDRIEARRSDWIKQFSGKSLANPSPEKWASDRRGGSFDTLTSATITSSAVIDAVARALQAYRQHDQSIWNDATTRWEKGERVRG